MNLRYFISKTSILKAAFFISMVLFVLSVWLSSIGFMQIFKLPIFFVLFIGVWIWLMKSMKRNEFIKFFLISAILTAGIVGSNIFAWKESGTIPADGAKFFSGNANNILLLTIILTVFVYAYFDEIAERIKSLI